MGIAGCGLGQVDDRGSMLLAVEDITDGVTDGVAIPPADGICPHGYLSI